MERATIDDTNTRAICDEIGERLRTLMKSSMTDETADLDHKLHQLLTQQGDGGGGSPATIQAERQNW